MTIKPCRVIAYVDGFNLNYGLKSQKWRRYYWLDLPQLVESLLKPDQQLVEVKYCTARITGPANGDPKHRSERILASMKRQLIWLEALELLDTLSIFEGQFISNTISCRQCQHEWLKHEEKMTDVQIATQMLADAFTNQFDMALVISADSDLVPPIETIRRHFPEKRTIAAFPPARRSRDLMRVANGYFTIGEAKLRQSQLPDEIKKPDGYVLRRPEHWQ